MKIISFNVNGLRARPHQLEEIISKHQPDVIGLQETKVHDEAFPLQDLSHYGYHIEYFGQKSHYGVALFTKEKPIHIYKGFPNDAADAQRRLISAEIPTSQGIITIINGYFPQGESREHETKFPAKQRFYSDLNNYIQQYIKTPVIVMGDMNICPTDKDIGLKSDNKKRWLAAGKCSFLPEERVWMNSLLENNLIDCYRHINPEKENEFSWFDYRSFGFDSNTGLRIDLILASQSLISYCTGSGIDYSIRAMEKPSDHAPVWVEFELYSK